MIQDRYSSPVIGVDGTRYGRIWTFRDITQQRRAEAAVRVQAHMLDNVGVAVMAADLAAQLTYANRFAQELHGWSSTEMIGKNF